MVFQNLLQLPVNEHRRMTAGIILYRLISTLVYCEMSTNTRSSYL